IAVAKAVLDDQVRSFDIPEIAKSGPDRVNVGGDSSGRGQTENPNPSDLRLLLRACRERPRGCRAAEQRDERAPFLIELHAIPHAERGTAPQYTELAAISQRVAGDFRTRRLLARAMAHRTSGRRQRQRSVRGISQAVCAGPQA